MSDGTDRDGWPIIDGRARFFTSCAMIEAYRSNGNFSIELYWPCVTRSISLMCGEHAETEAKIQVLEALIRDAADVKVAASIEVQRLRAGKEERP